jgi:hypothetical protein
VGKAGISHYNNLEEAEAIAWNWWLDKIMDHTRTVSRNDGIAASFCTKFCPGSMASSFCFASLAVGGFCLPLVLHL